MIITTETLLILALIAGFIGFVIWFETKLGKDDNSFRLVEDGPINTKTLETMLKENGIEKYNITDESIIHFNYHECLYWLDYRYLPIIRLGMLFKIDDYDMVLARRTAENVSNEWINLNVQIDSEKYLCLECMTFTNGLYSLIGALPNMMSYLEEGYLHYGQSYQLAQNSTKYHIPIKADKPS